MTGVQTCALPICFPVTIGEVYVYGAVIYLPKEAPEVLKGQKIQVVDESGNVRFSGNSTLFKREQLHSRLWV